MINTQNYFRNTAVAAFEKQNLKTLDRNIGYFIRELRDEYKLNDVPDDLRSLKFESDGFSFTYLGQTTIGIEWVCNDCGRFRRTTSGWIGQVGEIISLKCVGKCDERFPIWDVRDYNF